MSELPVSVRDLVQFCFREGDIDHRLRPAPTAVEGIEGHQRVYRRRSPDYRAEYPVSHHTVLAGLALELRGRADGFDPVQGLVEEIKTCRVSPASLPESLTRAHLAQGRLYAAMIAREHDLAALEVRLTWFHVDEDREYPLSQHYSRAELDDFLQRALVRFGHWLQRVTQQRAARDASLADLSFPFQRFRAGQREIAERVYKCCDQGGQLLLEAPTGLGKTMAVLYPALKALGRGKCDRIVFCTAKTAGRRAAEEAMARFAAAGYPGRAMTLSAKERVCLSPGKACHGDDCPYARGYYDRLPGAMEAALASPSLRREDLLALAETFRVCPYELGWDLLPWVDTVIADYHYVYGFTGSLAPVAGAPASGDRVAVLLDEAHNLPGRARGMYSASLRKAVVLEIRRALPAGGLRRTLERLNRALLSLQKVSWEEDGWHGMAEVPDDLQQALQLFAAEAGEQVAQQPVMMARVEGLMTLYFDVLQVLRCIEHWAEDFRLELYRGKGAQGLELRFTCLDASRLLALRQQTLHAAVTFSATLSPWFWARDALGLGGAAVCYRASSPFDPGQLVVSIASHVDTRYRQRDASLDQLAQLLCRWLRDVPGNCLLYFPSYRYLEACRQAMGPLPGRTVLAQAAGDGDAEREVLFEGLESRRDVAAFCVLGGVFGEGIDLPGERLTSVVVVGVGLPQVNRDTTSRQRLYEDRYGNGFAYAFQYPGMQRVSQALGRVVRQDGDRGQALLVDTRYRYADYRALLPPWWEYRAWKESSTGRD